MIRWISNNIRENLNTTELLFLIGPKRESYVITMRHGTANRRSRGRNSNNNNNRGKGGNNRAKVFDSNGPEVRIRGTAHQIFDKYSTLAKDAKSSGDHVLAESYLQHAEHYQRMIVEWDEQDALQQKNQPQRQNTDQQKTYSKTPEKEAHNDDLSLPSSILGDEVKVQDKAVREMENA